MNKDRRSRLRALTSHIDDLISELEDIQSEEQDSFDCLPESFQYSSRGEKMEEYISEIDDVIESARELSGTIEEMCE